MSQPVQGSACDQASVGVTCEWGTNIDPSCDQIGTCPAGFWSFSEHTPGSCLPSPPIVCPSSYGLVPLGSPCSPTGGFCDYPPGRCACIVPFLGGPIQEDASMQGQWTCANPGANCPLRRPNLGTECSPEGVTCDYGVCDFPGGAAQQCTGGIWVQAFVGCPAMGASP
jgi:hypothetical protein